MSSDQKVTNKKIDERSASHNFVFALFLIAWVTGPGSGDIYSTWGIYLLQASRGKVSHTVGRRKC
jgi:hypothetical protein